MSRGSTSPEPETTRHPQVAVTRVDSTGSADEARLLPGACVGRYMVLSRLGEGGMGVVYAAYDPELDRKIALKLLRSDPDADAPTRERERRLLKQEAQALAKLSHPSVIAIHDVGEHQGRVFMAMEFIDGRTLARWLRAERSVPEILDVFLCAGEGLRAAHDRGLVHRDFKPANVMVGQDGRVRVMDFGLARSAAALSGALDLAGTPAYMAPEQVRGEGVDARSDQFSFCVALWEGLYGQRPSTTITSEVSGGRSERRHPREPTRRVAVPRWVRQVVQRGMSAEPHERYPSMDALLGALRADPSRRRRRVRVVLGAVALAGVTAGGWAGWRAHLRSQCRDHAAVIESDWDPPARDAVRRALLDPGVAFGPETWERVESGLGDYAARWQDAHREACEAHRLEGRWTASRALAAAECLAERRVAFGSLVAVLSEPDLEVLIRADAAVHSLPQLDPCQDEAALDERRPFGVADRERAQQLREEAVRAETLWRAGRTDEGQARLAAALEDARALGEPETIARLDGSLGDVLMRQGEYERSMEHRRRSYFAWGRLGNDRAQRALALHMADVEAQFIGRPQVARTWLSHAQMLDARLEARGGATRAPSLRRAEAVVLIAEGDYEAAREAAKEALEDEERERGPDHPWLTAYRTTLADVEKRLGHYEASLALAEEELQRVRRLRGEHHPEVARALINLGKAKMRVGHLDETEVIAREALALAEQSVGRDHPWTASALQCLANVLFGRGEHEEAIALLERVVAIEGSDISAHVSLGANLVRREDHERAIAVLEPAYEHLRSAYGDDHPELMTVLINLGAAYRGRGDDERGGQAYREALRLGEASLGPEHPTLSFPLHNLGKLEQERGNLDQARPMLERALEIRRAAMGPEHPLTAGSLVELARVDLGQERPGDAIERLEGALAILGAEPAHAKRRSEAKLLLARALVNAGRSRARAIALAREARDEYAARGDEPARQYAIEWLREHG